MSGSGIKQVQLLAGVEDSHDGVLVDMKDHQPLDSEVFTSLLRASLAQYKQQGKKVIRIKLPIQLSNLVDAAIKEGFRYHQAELDYLTLVYWIPQTVDTLPPNASHPVRIGACVMNSKREVLVVQEARDTGVWKFPTGVVNQDEDIFDAAVREVIEETGIQAAFKQTLALCHSHEDSSRKSDLFFLCMLEPKSFNIQKQNQKIAAAQWMPIEEYAAQPYAKQNKVFNLLAQICLKKSEKDYTGYTPLGFKSSGNVTYVYFDTLAFAN